jgi:serine/threonine protein kinase
MTDLLGQTLSDRYHITSLIGKGGMADVYKVHDKLRNTELAIKVLRPDLAEDRAFVEHFREEAKTLKKLEHPNIVRFYSFERDMGVFFIVMDYVEGITLREEIKTHKGPFGFDRILQIMRGTCSALDYAHKSGYVHRDIKPANILTGNNKVFITDFGIAQFAGTSSSTLGRVGTPGYMSPEQIRGENPTSASDIYALGALLYEILTGRRPFAGLSVNTTGTSSERMCQEHLNLQPPSPRLYNPAIPLQLERAILRCLEKEPLNRFSSTTELLIALEHSISQLETSMPHVERPTINLPRKNIDSGWNKKLILWLLASSLVVVFILFAALNSSKGEVLPTPSGASVDKPIFQSPDHVSSPISPSQPSFSVRPYNTYTDLKIPLLWSTVKGLEFPAIPGSYSWETNVSLDLSMLLNLGWCASDKETLEANIRDIRFEVTLDGYPISDSQLNISEGTQNKLYCQQRAGVLSGLSQGKHTYIETMRIETAIFDGTKTYSVGNYIYELMINVK